MMKQLLSTLSKQSTVRILLLLNFIVAIVVFYHFRNSASGDERSYLNLADNILKGRYSMWEFDGHVPDTFRTPGYPIFLLMFRIFTKNIFIIKLAQLILYLSSILLMLSIVKKFKHHLPIQSIFLLILLPSIQVVYYSTLINPEALMTFLIALYIWLWCYKPVHESAPWRYVIVMGLLCGYMFCVRPIFLFFPVVKFLVDWIYLKKYFHLVKNLAVIAIYFITMIPYGLWNYYNHGTFRITCLEGGGGVFYFGYWSFKMPGYMDWHYWRGNIMSNEPINFADSTEAAENYKNFNTEFDSIEHLLQPLLNKNDSINLLTMNKEHFGARTYNANYTLAREKILTAVTWKHYKEEPLFFVKTRLYMLPRLWITGIQREDLRSKKGFDLFAAIYPFIVCCTAFLLFITLVTLAIWRYGFRSFTSILIPDLQPKIPNPVLLLFLLIFYFGLLHLAFALQARYTIPVRFEMFMLIALAGTALFKHGELKKSAG